MNDVLSRLSKVGWKLPFIGQGLLDHQSYEIKRVGSECDRLIGVEARTAGRFGNAAFANLYAIDAALALGVANVRLCEQDGILSEYGQQWRGVTIYTGNRDIGNGLVLCGPFTDLEHMPTRKNPNLKFRIECGRSVLRNFLDLSSIDSNSRNDEITIHIRAGDLFDEYIHPWYVQPPLAFYKKVLRETIIEGELSRVLVVYEDLKNPCVQPLLEHLKSSGIEFRAQSAELKKDLCAILNSCHLAFGTGSFVPQISLMSTEVQSGRFFVFSEEDATKRYGWIKDRWAYFDGEGGYMKPGEWRNTEEQRCQMLEYPESALRVVSNHQGA